MLRRLRSLTTVLALAALVAGHAAPASADLEDIDPKSVPPMFDLFVLRPVGLAVTAIGCIFFVPATAFTAMFRPTEIDKAYKVFIKDPITFTFLDPLGSHSGGDL